MTSAAEPSAWAEAMAALGRAGDRLTAQMLERGEREDSADAYLALLGALMDAYLNRLSVDAGQPAFLPCTGYYQRIGSPNPDTVYKRAPIEASGVYRLTGERGTVADATLMPFAEPSMRSWPPFDLSEVARGPEGAFDVIVSAERPAGHAGDWWRLEPGMSCLWLRATSDRWGEDQEPRIAIERLDGPIGQDCASSRVRERIAVLAASVEGIVGYGLRHADELAAAGVVNHVKAVDYGALGAMPRQWYHEGLFQLDDDQALLVEARTPPDCHYYSWSLTDRMLVTLDWMNAQASLNRSQAPVDPDGVLRVVVSGRDPGVRNWMDTSGRRSGVLQCRSIGSKEPPSFTTRLVPFEAAAANLPPAHSISPGERKEALRRRRIGSQLRRLW